VSRERRLAGSRTRLWHSLYAEILPALATGHKVGACKMYVGVLLCIVCVRVCTLGALYASALCCYAAFAALWWWYLNPGWMKYRQLGLCSHTQSNNQGPRAESCTLSLSRSERSQPSSQPSHTDVLPRHPPYSKQNDKLTSEAMHPFSGCSHCCWCFNSCKSTVGTIMYWFLFVIEEVIKNVKHIEMTDATWAMCAPVIMQRYYLRCTCAQ
jgi:hypothetical protein